MRTASSYLALVLCATAVSTSSHAQRLRGFVDLHTHPMSHLGFGGKALHGAPDVGTILPAGTRDCNQSPIRASSIDQALGHCNSTHGGWGVDNSCGDHLRATINYLFDGDFVHKIPFDKNPHGDHQHAGSPDFEFWPHHSSIWHQQMWWEWMKRARDGGLRVMVALTVNSEPLAEVLNGDRPYDDKQVANVQIAETIRFVDNHRDFMEIARSAADVRRIAGKGLIAVVLGMEVDTLGNFGKPGVETNEAAVRNEIQRLHRLGIRYIFPVHVLDNSFGGAAVYEPFFNFANKRANGRLFAVTTSPDPNVTYNATLLEGIFKGGTGSGVPFGFENVSLIRLRQLLEANGQLPAPCFGCFPPGRVICCGSYQSALRFLTPSPEWDLYKLIPTGHVNSRGLTQPLGEVAINEMMKLGMLIDVDHMSERTMTRVVEIAEGFPGGYPLIMGHNGLRGPGSSERSAPPALVRRIAALRGMFGVGTAKSTPSAFIDSYRAVWKEMGGRAVAIGTDVNGFERLPTHTHAATQAASDAFYARFLTQSGITTKQKTQNRTWDYVRDGGVSHYGLMPEFLFDVKTSPNGEEVYQNLMTSAEHFARTWEKAEGKRTITGLRAVEVIMSLDDDPDP
jgi:microsomal dipeptidase-like Zn-dependent dipeptidase